MLYKQRDVFDTLKDIPMWRLQQKLSGLKCLIDLFDCLMIDDLIDRLIDLTDTNILRKFDTI